MTQTRIAQNAPSPLLERLLGEQQYEAKCVRDTMLCLRSALWMCIGGLLLWIIVRNVLAFAPPWLVGVALLSLSVGVGLYLFLLEAKYCPVNLAIGVLLLWIITGSAVGFAQAWCFGVAFTILMGVVLYLRVLAEYGLYRLASLLGKLLIGRHVVRCPNCNTGYRMYETTSFYRCTVCLLPMHFSAQSAVMIRLACPHCQHAFAVDSSAKNVRCANCGTMIRDGELGADSGSDTCVRCQSTFPRGAYSCPECARLADAQDPCLRRATNDAQLARGTLGIAIHVRALLAQHFNYFMRKQDMSGVALCVTTPLREIIELLSMCIEGRIGDDSRNARHLPKIEKMLDRIYAVSLRRAFAFMQANPTVIYDECTINKLYVDGVPAVDRRRLHEAGCVMRAGGDLGTEVAPYPEWTRPLVDRVDLGLVVPSMLDPDIWREWFHHGGVQTTCIIRDCSRLKEEAVRVWPEVILWY